MEVGVRALRDALSRHLAQVQAGHTVTITEHGRPIARIIPVGRPTAREELIAQGRITPARRQKKPAPRPVRTTGMVSDLVAEQRR
jgi:prevent-host-death family protein